MRHRNMFDPDRRPTGGNPAPRTEHTSSHGRSNYIMLTGTMVTDSKSLAFFSGGRAEYGAVVSLKGKIADFTVSDVSGSAVELTLPGAKPVTVAVGQAVPLAGSIAASQPATEPEPTPEPSPRAVIAPPAGAPTGSDDIVRRMMDRRQKELIK